MVDYSNNNHYNKMEEILQYITSHFITLRKKDCSHINVILREVVESVIENIRFLSPLFYYLYEGPYYGGSYYCGLKVKTPDEFDIDLKLHLPEIVNPKLFIEENTGFVQIMLQDVDKLYQSNYSSTSELKKLLDEENYIVQNKIISWFYGLVCKALILLNPHFSGCIITPHYNGPAIKLSINYSGLTFDIDLVISFVFSEKHWPGNPFRPAQEFQRKTFLTVPKKPKFCTYLHNRYFRFSFQEQENEILQSNYQGKPVFRLLKKLRDTRMHNTSSYVLKTIFLWEVEEKKRQNNNAYWCLPLSVIFLDMLETYKRYMFVHNVPYFWNSHENLITHTKRDTCQNIVKFLEKMISTIRLKIEQDTYIFAKFLLTEAEYRQLINHFRGTPNECSRYDEFWFQEVQSNINSD